MAAPALPCLLSPWPGALAFGSGSPGKPSSFTHFTAAPIRGGFFVATHFAALPLWVSRIKFHSSFACGCRAVAPLEIQ
jgi:hypothetical protein